MKRGFLRRLVPVGVSSFPTSCIENDILMVVLDIMKTIINWSNIILYVLEVSIKIWLSRRNICTYMHMSESQSIQMTDKCYEEKQ